MKIFICLYFISILSIISLPAFAAHTTPPCVEQLRAAITINDRLVSHVRGWLGQYSGFAFESIEIAGSQITVRGARLKKNGIALAKYPSKIRFRKSEYTVKIEFI